jgi:hypothetical protein
MGRVVEYDDQGREIHDPQEVAAKEMGLARSPRHSLLQDDGGLFTPLERKWIDGDEDYEGDDGETFNSDGCCGTAPLWGVLSMERFGLENPGDCCVRMQQVMALRALDRKLAGR